MVKCSDQLLIVWNNGFKYIKEILDIIRNHEELKITRIYKRKINFNSDFFKKLYSLDTNVSVSKELIKMKSEQLKKENPYIFLIFLKDLNTILKSKPSNGFKYTFNTTFIKWKIRLQFNPRDANVPFRPQVTDKQVEDATIQKWWLKGVSHRHIIHGSDIEGEAQLMIDYFKLNKHDFSLQGNNYYKLPKKITTVKIDDILCNTLDWNGRHITETPHYKFLLGKRKEYDDYIMRGLGTVITYDNLSGSYDNLIKNFNYGIKIDNIPQYVFVKKCSKGNKYQGLDGGHRMAILYHSGVRSIKVWELI